MEDTKAFKELQSYKENRLKDNNIDETSFQKSPIIEAIKKYPKRIILAAGAFLSIQVTFYILIAFMLVYGVSDTNLSRSDILTAILIASAIQIPVQFVFASYSDRHGRKGIFMLGAVLTALWAFAIFPLVDTGSFWLTVLAITGGLVFLSLIHI